MKRILLKDANYGRERKALCSRMPVPPEIEERVRQIVAAVSDRGDKAIAEFLEKFDGVTEHRQQACRIQANLCHGCRQAPDLHNKAVKVSEL